MSRELKNRAFVRWVIWLTLPITVTLAVGIVAKLLPALGMLAGFVWWLAALAWLVATPIVITVAVIKWLSPPSRERTPAEGTASFTGP